MNFKAPRCKDTKPDLRKIRDVTPSENILCGVGSGECRELAVEIQDGGDTEFPICAKHLPEFIALATLIAEMTPEQVSNFDQSIRAAEEQKGADHKVGART